MGAAWNSGGATVQQDYSRGCLERWRVLMLLVESRERWAPVCARHCRHMQLNGGTGLQLMVTWALKLLFHRLSHMVRDEYTSWHARCRWSPVPCWPVPCWRRWHLSRHRAILRSPQPSISYNFVVSYICPTKQHASLRRAADTPRPAASRFGTRTFEAPSALGTLCSV